MIAFLVMQEKMGKLAVEDLPERYRAAVEAALEGNGDE